MDNDIIKKPYQVETFTQEQIEELSRCFKDPKYFIVNHVMIRSTKGATKFELYPFQHEIIDTFHSYRNSIMLTARQMGKCVVSDTNITFNDEIKKIEEVIPMTVKEKIINYLEKKMLSLSL